MYSREQLIPHIANWQELESSKIFKIKLSCMYGVTFTPKKNGVVFMVLRLLPRRIEALIEANRRHLGGIENRRHRERGEREALRTDREQEASRTRRMGSAQEASR